jgi:hypothetical protein
MGRAVSPPDNVRLAWSHLYWVWSSRVCFILECGCEIRSMRLEGVHIGWSATPPVPMTILQSGRKSYTVLKTDSC